MLLSYGAIPVITKPTRVTDTIYTIFDHVITNVVVHDVIPGVIDSCEISDHYATFCIFCCVNVKLNPTKKLSTHCCFRYNSNAYNENLENVMHCYLSSLPQISWDNSNSVFNKFNHLLLQTIDTHAPLKKMSRKQQKLRKNHG